MLTIIKKQIGFILLFFCTFSTFLTSNCFIESTIIPKWYSLILVSFLGFGYFLLTSNLKIPIDKFFVFFITFLAYIIIRCLLSNAPLIDFVMVFSIVTLYFFFRGLELEEEKFHFLFITATVLQAFYGLLQYFQLIQIDGNHQMLGTYDNPAGLAANLAFTFPLLFFYIRKYRLLVIVVATIIIITIVLSKSRSGTFTVSLTCVIYFFNKLSSKFGKSKKILLIGLTILLGGWLWCLFLFKMNSAIGRLLIWEVTCNTIKECFFWGQGFYGFLNSYMLNQAAYFSHNSGNPSYNLLAGNITHPLNEYLLLILKFGFVSLLFVICICIVLWKDAEKSSPYFLCIVSIIVFSFFSYSFKYPITSIMLLFSIVQLTKNSKVIGRMSLRLLSGIFGAFTLLCLCIFIKDVRFEYKWSKVAKFSINEQRQDIEAFYEELYKNWNGNPLFLYNYAAEMEYLGMYEKSNEILAKLLLYWNDYYVQMMLGNNFKLLDKYEAAEEHFKVASNMVPNRFMPLFNLHEIYVKSNRKKEALDIAKHIVSKNVKIPSAKVTNIQSKMRKYIRESM